MLARPGAWRVRSADEARNASNNLRISILRPMVEDAPKHWSRFGSPLRSRPSLVEAEPRLGPLAFLDKADAAKEPVHAAVDGSVWVARERRRHP